MNSQPQHIQKQVILDGQENKYEYKFRKKPSAIQFNQETLLKKDRWYSWKELNTNNGKIGPWSRDLLDMHLKYLFPLFLGLSTTIPLIRLSSDLFLIFNSNQG